MAFHVASPALFFTTLQDSEARALFSGNLVANAGAIVVTVVLNASVLAVPRTHLGTGVVATLSSSYCNAGNLGLPTAF